MNTFVSPVIYLLRRDLVAREACADGLALFDELAALQGRKRSLRLTWTHLLWLVTDARSREYVAWAQRGGLLPRLGLAFENLRGADLEGADLEGADLRGADLRGADLKDANLEGADLEGANLRGADLEGANLRYASLAPANLFGANLAYCARLTHDAPIKGWVVRNGVLVEAA